VIEEAVARTNGHGKDAIVGIDAVTLYHDGIASGAASTP